MEDDLQQDTSYYLYGNERLKKKGKFENGLYQGEWIFYYENGNPKRVGHYELGLPSDSWKFYFENGRLSKKVTFWPGKNQDFGNIMMKTAIQLMKVRGRMEKRSANGIFSKKEK